MRHFQPSCPNREVAYGRLPSVQPERAYSSRHMPFTHLHARLIPLISQWGLLPSLGISGSGCGSLCLSCLGWRFTAGGGACHPGDGCDVGAPNVGVNVCVFGEAVKVSSGPTGILAGCSVLSMSKSRTRISSASFAVLLLS